MTHALKLAEGELLGCPFCGGDQITTAPSSEFPFLWSAICKACGASRSHETELDAIAAWNTRQDNHPSSQTDHPTEGEMPRLKQLHGELCRLSAGLRFDLRKHIEFGEYYNQAVKDGLGRLDACCDTLADVLISTQPSRPQGEGELRALDDIAAERRRQVEVEGWTLEHDDEHGDGALAEAAAVYATSRPIADENGHLTSVGHLWPWSLSWFKPKGRRPDLVRAGALIVAEIERLDRRANPKETDHGGA